MKQQRIEGKAVKSGSPVPPLAIDVFKVFKFFALGITHGIEAVLLVDTAPLPRGPTRGTRQLVPPPQQSANAFVAPVLNSGFESTFDQVLKAGYRNVEDLQAFRQALDPRHFCGIVPADRSQGSDRIAYAKPI
jgi:hypothetical protein